MKFLSFLAFTAAVVWFKAESILNIEKYLDFIPPEHVGTATTAVLLAVYGIISWGILRGSDDNSEKIAERLKTINDRTKNLREEQEALNKTVSVLNNNIRNLFDRLNNGIKLSSATSKEYVESVLMVARQLGLATPAEIANLPKVINQIESIDFPDDIDFETMTQRLNELSAFAEAASRVDLFALSKINETIRTVESAANYDHDDVVSSIASLGEVMDRLKKAGLIEPSRPTVVNVGNASGGDSSYSAAARGR